MRVGLPAGVHSDRIKCCRVVAAGFQVAVGLLHLSQRVALVDAESDLAAFTTANSSSAISWVASRVAMWSEQRRVTYSEPLGARKCRRRKRRHRPDALPKLAIQANG